MRIGTRAIVVSGVCLVVIIGLYAALALLPPTRISAPAPRHVVIPPLSSATAPVWPADGQSAVGLLGNTFVQTHQTQTPVPTASVAKLITALVVLQAKPLSIGQPGPTITLSSSDVAIYRQYLGEQGSVVPVEAGEAISEYQMLEAMLLPSANNMADSLAIWAYGSLTSYALAANSFLAQAGLHQTHVGTDASGYNPSTTSTAHDLVLLGELAMGNPVIAQIVGLPSATGIPLTTTIKNVNSLLGSDGIVGIKTGNTDQAGGVFVSASHVDVSNQTLTVVTALAASPTLAEALSSSAPLIQSTHNDFQTSDITKSGAIVAHYTLPWGGSVAVVAANNLSAASWNAAPISETLSLSPVTTDTTSSQTIGKLSVKQLPLLSGQTVSLRLQNPIPRPSLWWRLTHPRL